MASPPPTPHAHTRTDVIDLTSSTDSDFTPDNTCTHVALGLYEVNVVGCQHYHAGTATLNDIVVFVRNEDNVARHRESIEVHELREGGGRGAMLGHVARGQANILAPLMDSDIDVVIEATVARVEHHPLGLVLNVSVTGPSLHRASVMSALSAM